MPKIAIDWETTEVSFYKFVCQDTNILYSYVGHTTNFSKRKGSHKSHCNNPKDKSCNTPLYVFIREHKGWDNWDMVQIHSQICKDKLEARQIEQELLEQQQFKLNASRAYISEEQRLKYNSDYQEEYRKNHTLNILEYNTKYYEENHSKISEYQANYYERNCIKILERNANYYQKNHSKILDQKAEYHEKNRDIINAKRRAKYALQKAQLNCEILDATNP